MLGVSWGEGRSRQVVSFAFAFLFELVMCKLIYGWMYGCMFSQFVVSESFICEI